MGERRRPMRRHRRGRCAPPDTQRIQQVRKWARERTPAPLTYGYAVTAMLGAITTSDTELAVGDTWRCPCRRLHVYTIDGWRLWWPLNVGLGFGRRWPSG